MLIGQLRHQKYARHGLVNTNHTTIETQTVHVWGVSHLTIIMPGGGVVCVQQPQTTPATKTKPGLRLSETEHISATCNLVDGLKHMPEKRLNYHTTTSDLFLTLLLTYVCITTLSFITMI